MPSLRDGDPDQSLTPALKGRDKIISTLRVDSRRLDF
jgi:hypothetical protein